MDQKEDVIIPEVLDEQGQIIQANEPPAWNDPNDHARPKGQGGILSGFFVFFVGFLVTVFVFLFSLLFLIPCMLLGRLFGFSIKKFQR